MLTSKLEALKLHHIPDLVAIKFEDQVHGLPSAYFPIMSQGTDIKPNHRFSATSKRVRNEVTKCV